MTALRLREVPADILANPRLGSWLTVTDDGLLGVRVGKVELGQGIVTALAQIAADALGVTVDQVRMLPAHTRLGPDEGLKSGSKSTEHAGPALRHLEQPCGVSSPAPGAPTVSSSTWSAPSTPTPT